MGETHPAPQSGAAILVQCLLNHGVEVVFAYPGGANPSWRPKALDLRRGRPAH